MYDGFIKVAAATPRIRVADVDFNACAIIDAMEQAARAGVRILVLPELCLTGYTCGDLFMHDALLSGAMRALERITSASAPLDMLTLVGLPVRARGNVYDCAAVIHRGSVLAFIPKTHLPNYGEFAERRYFAPPDGECGHIMFAGGYVPFGSRLLLRCADMPELAIGVEIGSDLWAPDTPSVGLAAAGASIICNLSASSETVGKADYRRTLIKAKSGSLVAGYIYSDAGEGESTTDSVFAGHDMICENGNMLAESAPFENGMLISEIDLQRLMYERRRMHTFESAPCGYSEIPFHMSVQRTELTRDVSAHPFIPDGDCARAELCESILRMQAAGLAKRLEHAHARTAVVGISGGLDSCLALLAAVRAMDMLERPRTDVLSITMPCFGTTARTRTNAERMTELVGATPMRIDISASVRQHFADIGQSEDVHDVTYENSQARERTQVLMDVANRTGGMVVGTGDLSELVLGWATYNGDHMSMYGVNASIPKTLIRHIVRYAAETAGEGELRDTLMDILATPVSPELLPARDGEIAQVTEDLVGPYELHDFFIYHALRWCCPPRKVFRLALHALGDTYDRATILKWLRTFYRRFFQQQFKRSCLPDGPKIGSVALSPRGDLRLPSDACAELWLKEVDEIE